MMRDCASMESRRIICASSNAQGSPFDQKKEYLLNQIIGRDAGGRRINSHLLHDGSSIVRFEVGPPSRRRLRRHAPGVSGAQLGRSGRRRGDFRHHEFDEFDFVVDPESLIVALFETERGDRIGA